MSMRKIREVLRLHFELGRTHREIAAACSVSPATVGDYLGRAMRAGLAWEQAQSLSEAEVEAKLFTYIGRSELEMRAAVDFDWVHRELRRHGVTLQLLWGDQSVCVGRGSVHQQ
jgi:DNA-binding transcriptional regulator LsrR (DeoR family)